MLNELGDELVCEAPDWIEVQRFKKSEYWNGTSVGITNNPELVWIP